MQNNTEVTASINTIEGIDMKKISSFMCENPERYLRVLGIFQREGMQKLQDISKCFANRDLGLYITYVHALKSASANIGAEELSQASAKLENAGKQGDWDYISKHNKGFLKQLNNILESIGNSLKPESRFLNIEASINNCDLIESLRIFKQALIECNPAIIKKTAQKLRKYSDTWGNNADDVTVSINIQLKEILYNKTTGAYDVAVSMIDNLLHSLVQRAKI
ncbi:MAG: Hpt domain-containing protein [Defluviitaleaceae bacterium]|nr:Hpt domain-containing protein [Defluviitaleaceae bacterium]